MAMLGLGQAAAIFNSSVSPANANLTVALVRSAPPNWPMPLLTYDWTGAELNISETVDEGIRLIKVAAHEGAGMVTFPELWFPGFPKGNAVNNWTVHTLPMYIENSLTVGSDNWNRIIDGIKEAGIYTALAFSELRGDRIFMAQALVSPLGDILIHRHKLRPSGSERWFFSDGTTDGLQVVTTSRGRVGLLECGEHYYPSMNFIMQAQMENIHLAPFPYMADPFDPEALWWEDATANTGALTTYAINSGAYTMMNAIGYAAAFDPRGNTIASMSAATNMTEKPMLYTTIDTSAFNTSATFNPNGQTSWAVLQQIYDAFPKEIPRVAGDLVPPREHSVAWLLSGALTSEVGEKES